MNELAISIFWGVVILTLIQVAFTVPFANLLKLPQRPAAAHPQEPLLNPSYQPPATLLLCLQGVNPGLADCIQGLLHQDYPHYTLHIVVESASDPAWERVKALVPPQSPVKVHLSVLQQPLNPHSFACNGLLQTLTDLPPTSEVIVLLHPDTVPHPTWLRELVTPLADDRIGATTGHGWYSPNGRQPGTLLRYLWNASTVVMLYFNQLPWRGAIAFRTDLIPQTQLLTTWQHTLSDVLPLCRALQQRRQKIQFVPSLISINAQECTLPHFARWAIREMLMIRLYHPSWWGTVIASLINSLVLGRAVVMWVMMIGLAEWQAMLWIGAGLALYAIAIAGLVGLLQQGVGRVVPHTKTNRIALGSIGPLLLGILVAQFVQTGILLAALWVKKEESITHPKILKILARSQSRT
jgi:Glycosyltransferase like family 2